MNHYTTINTNNLNQADISIETNGYEEIIKFKVTNKDYEIPAKQLPYYSFEIKNLKNNNYKETMVHYILTTPKLGLKKILVSGNNYKIEVAPILQCIKAQHDPEPCHNLFLYLYASLQSIQWHLLSHGIVDYWMNPTQPFLMSEIINPKTMQESWDGFLGEVNCPRWGEECINIKPYDSNRQGFKDQWDKQRRKLNTYAGNIKVQGCYQCIDEYGAEQFIKCCNYFLPIRNNYLTRLRKWVINTIQDNNFNYYYENSKLPIKKGKESKRRHIHATDNGTGSLWAYVIEEASDKKSNIYIMKFKLDNHIGAAKNHYILKTVYGFKTENSFEEAETTIKAAVNNTTKRLNIRYRCYSSNLPI